MARTLMRGTTQALLVVLLLAFPLSSVAMAQSTDDIDWEEEFLNKPPGAKSMGFYVGKNLTEDGSVIIGGFGHEPSSHWIEIVPRRQFPEGATTRVGVTSAANFPGVRIDIPQARETNKYITSNYSEWAGFPAPLTNGGLNEHGVAGRDIWSNTIPRLRNMTPNPQTGLNYSDLSRIAMERATTAREAVEIVGELIDEYGYATYGGNSHMWADKDEGWVLINYAGGQNLWAAQRLGPDDVRVSYPGYLKPFPLDYKDHPDEYLASDNFIDFAVSQGWFDPSENSEFDPQAIYSGFQPNAQLSMERELREVYAPVSVDDMMAVVRDPRWSNDQAGYGQVAQLRQNVEHSDLRSLWVAVTGAVTTPYIPIFMGAEDVPPEYKQHRYMTSGSASGFIARDYAPLEATRYATRTFKRLMYHTCENPETFLKPVTAELEAFEQELLEEQGSIEEQALQQLSAGQVDAARMFLTEYAEGRLLDGLDLGESLVQAVEDRTREQFGIRMPTGRDLPGETYRPESQSMNTGGGLSGGVSCFRSGFETYPRLHGSYSELVGTLLPPLQPQSKQDCMAGGWREFGFQNQGHCVASVAAGQSAGLGGGSDAGPMGLIAVFVFGASAGLLMRRRGRLREPVI